MANRLSTSATNNGTGHWLEAGAGTLAETGLLASSTIDFACAAASFAAASWPLVSIRCCVSRSRSAGCSDAFGGVDSGLLAGALFAGGFFSGCLFTRFFCGLVDCLGWRFVLRRCRCAVGFAVGLILRVCHAAAPLQLSLTSSSAPGCRVPSCQDASRRL